jgi:hypothetical protein
MSERIELVATPVKLTVSPGESAECAIALRNRGKTVDQITIAVEGIDPGWYNLPVSSVALFPNDQDNVKLIVRLPETIESRDTVFNIKVKATSQESPGDITSAGIVLEIKTAARLEVAISPESVSGRKGTYQVSIINPDAREARISLKAASAQRRLRLDLQPDSLTVPGGGRSEAVLNARLNWIAVILGGKAYQFKLEVEQTGGVRGESIVRDGQLVNVPWYRVFSRIRLPWFSRPPVIKSFEATTENKRDFKLKWMTQRAVRVQLGDAEVESQGESLVHPAETAQYVLTVTNRHGVITRTVEVRPLPVPQARISDKISLSLSPTSLKAQAGIVPAQALVQVKNLSEIVDKFIIEVEGLDETWYSRSASSIALMPQASDQVSIMFQPQKKKGVRSGIYPFGITVRSQSTAGVSATVVGQLEILPATEFKIKIRPFRTTAMRKATYQVNLANTGVSDAEITLEASDLDEGCKFQFKPSKLLLGAWNSIDVPFVIRPKKRGWIIGAIKRFDVTVTATPENGMPQTATCEFNHSPLMKSWKPIWRLIKILIALAVIIVAIYYILKLGGGWSAFRHSPGDWFDKAIKTIEGWF